MPILNESRSAPRRTRSVTPWLSLGALLGLVGCGGPAEPECLCDAMITKTALSDLVVGEPAIYEIQVSYWGDEYCEDGALCFTDSLPAGLVPDTASGTDWACTISGQDVGCCYDQPLPTDISTIDPVQVVVTVDPDAGDSITNCASIDQGDGFFADQAETNNESCVDSTVERCDLGIDKVWVEDGAGWGAWLITVTNDGTTDQGSIRVEDTLPVGMDALSWSTGWTCSQSGQDLECWFTSILSPGDTAELELEVTTPGGSGELENCATVFMEKGGCEDADDSNDTACATLPLTCDDLDLDLSTGLDADALGLADLGGPDGSWWLTADPGGGVVPRSAMVVNGSTSYGVYSAAMGTSQWVGVTSDANGLTSDSPGGDFTYRRCFCVDPGAIYATLDLSMLADNSVREVRLNGSTMWSGKGGIYDDKALSLSFDDGFQEGSNCLEIDVHNSPSSWGTDTPTALDVMGTLFAEQGTCCGADLTIDKSGDTELVYGGSATWTLELTNSGDVDQVDIVITDSLPSGLSYAGQTNSTEWTCAEDATNAQTITCFYQGSPLAPGASSSLDLLVDIANEDGPWDDLVVENCATAWSSAPDSNPDDNQSCVTATVEPLGQLRRLDAGEGYTCLVKTDGTVWCWGFGTAGQLGDGLGITSAVPVQVAGINDAVEVDVGHGRSCARLSSGDVSCWANGLGDGTWNISLMPVSALLSSAVDLAVGGDSGSGGHSCAVDTSGTGWCWGEMYGDTLGVLGLGGGSGAATPTAITVLPSVAAMTAGDHHTCALDTAGQPWCWGGGGAGELGDGNGTNSTSAVAVSLSGPARTVDAGNHHTCAIDLNGDGWCWGENGNGQLGDGSTVDSPVPVSMGLGDLVDLSAGESHSCAVQADGDLYCWGFNYDGQIGIGTEGEPFDPSSADEPSPVKLELGGVVEVAAGDGHTCALLDDETAWCWGLCSSGQLGNGTTSDCSSVPVEVGL